MPEYPLEHPKAFGDWTVKSVHDISGHGDLYAEYIVNKEGGPDRLLKTPRPQFVDTLKYETKLLAKLDHPNIVKLIDCDLQADPMYRVTELSTVGRFRDALVTWQAQRLWLSSIDKQLQIIADTIGWLHSQGITHNAINAGHILIYDNATPKLVHFRKSVIHTDTFPNTSKDIKDFELASRIIRDEAEAMREQLNKEPKDASKVKALDIAPPKALATK